MTSEGLDISGYEPTTPEARRAALIEVEVDEGMESDMEFRPRGKHSSSSSLTGLEAEARASISGLSISGWQRNVKPEILIFIHGYNISLNSAMRKLGQLTSAGRFPPHIKPFVFSWPTGKVLYYFQSVRLATGDTTIECFRQFLQSIIKSGVQNIHLFTHSCGVKILMKALNEPAIQELLSPLHPREPLRDDQPPRLHLRTTTMTNADYPIRDFRSHDYQILRSYCKHITFYVDKYDDALKWASLFTRRRVLGHLSTPLYFSSSDADERLLDVDVIDASGLQHNMDPVRHAAFTVNRMMVEDLREIIVSRKRASDRPSRLVNKKGNLYCFMTTPIAVTGNAV